MLAGTALGALGTSIALGVELALLEPRLAYLISLRTAGYAMPGAAVELLVVTLIFALVLLAMLVAAARVAYGFRFPVAWRARARRPVAAAAAARRRASPSRRELAPAGIDRSRATAVADAVAASQRRETGPRRRRAGRRRGRAATVGAAARRRARRAAARRRCRSARAIRRTRNRASASASRRDSGRMNKQAREALDAYYVEADSWGKDRQDALRASRRIAWIVAWCAAAIAVMEAIALVVLMPLKTVEPYTLLVDRNTGFVQALKPLDPQRISPDTALTQSFLVQYVIARESFDIDTIQADYRKVALWSAEQARTRLCRRHPALEPAKPARALSADDRDRDAGEERVADGPEHRHGPLRDPAARRRRPGAAAPRYVAIIRYRYSGEPMSVEDRFVNPLGFQVLRYRRDAEALPPEAASPPPPTAAGPPVREAAGRPVPARPRRAAAAGSAGAASCEARARLPARARPGRARGAGPSRAGQRRSAHPDCALRCRPGRPAPGHARLSRSTSSSPPTRRSRMSRSATAPPGR